MTPGKKKGVFFFNCGIHAREWISPTTCMYMLWNMLERSNSDSNVKKVLDDYEWNILPVFNVDGYEYTHTRVCWPVWLIKNNNDDDDDDDDDFNTDKDDRWETALYHLIFYWTTPGHSLFFKGYSDWASVSLVVFRTFDCLINKQQEPLK